MGAYDLTKLSDAELDQLEQLLLKALRDQNEADVVTNLVDEALPELRKVQKHAREIRAALIPPDLAAIVQLARPERTIRVIEGGLSGRV